MKIRKELGKIFLTELAWNKNSVTEIGPVKGVSRER